MEGLLATNEEGMSEEEKLLNDLIGRDIREDEGDNKNPLMEIRLANFLDKIPLKDYPKEEISYGHKWHKIEIPVEEFVKICETLGVRTEYFEKHGGGLLTDKFMWGKIMPDGKNLYIWFAR